jgi:hypothetical protein
MADYLLLPRLHWNQPAFGDIQVCGKKAKIRKGFFSIVAIFL